MNEEERRIQETGSNNINKATPEWLAILKQAREEHVNCDGTGCEYEIHHAYRLVNQQVAEGVLWAKCANCGSPFHVKASGNSTTCSKGCYDEFSDSLMEEW